MRNKTNIGGNKMQEKTKENFRRLASNGFGDDTVYDQTGALWVVFRLLGFCVYVRSLGGSYTDVEAVV